MQYLFYDFEERYNSWFLAAVNVNDYTLFCTVVDATTLVYSANWFSTVPKVTEWVDERTFQGIGQQFQYNITVKHWEATIEVDRDTLDDDRLQLAQQRVSQLGQEAGRFPWEMFVNALTANTACYDGQNFFSTTHSEMSSGTQSNLLTGTGTTVTALQTDLGTAIAALRGFKDGYGRPMNLGKRGLHVLAPAAMEQQFMQILNNDFIIVAQDRTPSGGSAGNIFSQASNWFKGIADLTIDPYLDATDTDDWYLFDTAEPDKPFLYVNRKSPEFAAQTDPQADPTFSRRLYRYGTDFRSQVGYGPWFLAVKVAQD
jgi:phage major head subunit gpT-like protein